MKFKEWWNKPVYVIPVLSFGAKTCFVVLVVVLLGKVLQGDQKTLRQMSIAKAGVESLNYKVEWAKTMRLELWEERDKIRKSCSKFEQEVNVWRKDIDKHTHTKFGYGVIR